MFGDGILPANYEPITVLKVWIVINHPIVMAGPMEIHRMYYMHSLIQALGRNGFKQQNVRPP